MKFPQEVLESLLNKTRLDHKGKNLYCECPYCGEDEFGISLGENHLFRCFRGKHCGAVGNIFTLLKYLGRTELLSDEDYYKETDVFGPLGKNVLNKGAFGVNLDLPNVSSPAGWRRVKSHKYLEGRGFTKAQFDKYEVGVTNLLRKYKDYVIFLIRQDGFIKGYVSRSTKSKQEIDAINKEVKEYNLDKPKEEHRSPLIRYSNSTDTDFSKIVYGIDEVVPRVTTTIIIVEGLLDKVNLEIIAPELFEDKKIVVCCTWGKKISEYQIEKIKSKKIKKVILMYDPDAVNDSKQFGFELDHEIDTVEIGFLKDKDPGDLNAEEFIEVLNNLSNPVQFSQNSLQKRNF